MQAWDSEAQAMGVADEEGSSEDSDGERTHVRDWAGDAAGDIEGAALSAEIGQRLQHRPEHAELVLAGQAGLVVAPLGRSAAGSEVIGRREHTASMRVSRGRAGWMSPAGCRRLDVAGWRSRISPGVVPAFHTARRSVPGTEGRRRWSTSV
jgi:hypothetical protein